MSTVSKYNVDVAIIGGGPGGLGAAIRAKEEGAKKVVLIERSEELGGVLPQCIHVGFGLHYFKEELTGPEYAYKLIKKAENVGVEFMTHTMVIEIDRDRCITALSKKALVEIKPRALMLTMGCRERARGAIRIPGDRPAGIFTAGTAQRIINIEGYIPGKKIAILGSGDIGMIMARRFTLEGAKVVFVAEALPFIGGLIRNEIQCLRDFDIPTYTSHTVTNIIGNERIERVVLSKVDQKMNIIAGTEKEYECDTLLLSVGLIPENELSRMMGVELNPLTGGPLVDNLWQTNVHGVFAAGNVVHVHDLADYVTESCEYAATNAVKCINSNVEEPIQSIEVRAGENIRYVVPNKITSKNSVSFFMRVNWPLKEATVKIDDIKLRTFKFVRPSEQIRIDVESKLLARLSKNAVVSCEGEEVIPR